jgi:trk system potassium uptake protein TrkH
MAPLKIRGEVVPEPKAMNIVGFFILFMLLFGFFSLVMTLFIPDLTTAVTAVIATIGDIGPGLGGVGPTQSYGWIPAGGKWVLVFCMLLGRLEIFTVLVLFRLSFWKR